MEHFSELEQLLKICFDPKLCILIFVADHLRSFLINHVHLKKVSKYDGFIINNSEFLTEYRQSKRMVDFDKETVPILLPYLEILKDYTDSENLKTLYHNLHSVQVNKKFPFIIFLGINMVAAYLPQNNTITYFNTSSLGHEFLHLASSSYDKEKKIMFSGFMQRSKEFSIGRGITEGYSELLASRIYNAGKVQSYERNVKIARLLELFFDDPKEMEELYFHYNLPGLINHLEGFVKRDEVIKMIIGVDCMSSFPTTSKLFPTYANIKTQVQLYNWFMAKSQDADKKAIFDRLVRESTLASLVLNGQRMGLCTENKFAKDSLTSSENHKLK